MPSWHDQDLFCSCCLRLLFTKERPCESFAKPLSMPPLIACFFRYQACGCVAVCVSRLNIFSYLSIRKRRIVFPFPVRRRIAHTPPSSVELISETCCGDLAVSDSLPLFLLIILHHSVINQVPMLAGYMDKFEEQLRLRLPKLAAHFEVR